MSPKTRTAMTLVELLVVIAIIGILMALLFPALSAMRAAALETECAHNMRQLGQALHLYADVYRVFPIENALPAGSTPLQQARNLLYVKLLPFVDQGQQDPLQPEPVSTFLCPTRRDTSVGCKDDFAAADNSSLNIAGALYLTNSILGATNLSAQVNPGIPPSRVQENDGMSNTLFLSHKGLREDQYGENGPNDPGWNSTTLADHQRRADQILFRDTDPINPMIQIHKGFSSPHPKGIPCLWADGHVSGIAYKVDTGQWMSLWTYKDSGELKSGVAPPSGVVLGY